MRRTSRGRAFALLLTAFVLLATVVAALAAPDGAPANAAAPGGPIAPPGPLVVSRPLGEISNGWTLAFSVPAYANGAPFHVYGMTFPSRNVGFVFGGDSWDNPDVYDNGTLINPGRVYRTKDGGKTWHQVLSNRGWKIGMACNDELHCWVGGKGGQIYFTSDGGEEWLGANEYTWEGMNNWPTPPVQTPVPFGKWIRSATVASAGLPVVFGATDNTILHSSDGVNFYNYWPMLDAYVATWSVACPSSSVCYGGQINKRVVKSTDGGVSWTMPAFTDDQISTNCLQAEYPNQDPNAQDGIQHRYYGLAFIDTNYGWTVGSCGLIFRTRNGAASRWERQMPNLSKEVQLRRVQAFDAKTAIAAGGDTPNPADPSESLRAVVYRTTDGVNWSPVAAPETNELHGLAAFSDATFVADWSANVWRWDGELVPVPESTSTPTPTPTGTETPAATETPTETPTATPTEQPSTGSIEVVAFFDINLNGKPDQGETPLGGAGFSVSRSATPVATGITGENGSYVFANLEPGTYRVDETMPPQGYTPNITEVKDIGISAGSAPVLPFPHRMSTVTPQPTATPTGTVEMRRVWLPLLVR